MSYLQKIKRFFIRVLIYQIVLLWPFIKINNIEKNAEDFKDKILRNLNYFGIKNKMYSEIAEDPAILFVLCALEIIFGIFGVFGSFYGNLGSAILFAISTTIYFNPLLPENRMSLYQTRIEVLYNIGILLALLLCAFYPYPTKEDTKKNLNIISDFNQENEEETEGKEVEMTHTKTSTTKAKKGNKRL
jgi:hypothetical protein